MTGAFIMLFCGAAVAALAAMADAFTGFVLYRAEKRADRMRRNG